MFALQRYILVNLPYVDPQTYPILFANFGQITSVPGFKDQVSILFPRVKPSKSTIYFRLTSFDLNN